MNIAITGATGFVARHLISKLRESGHEIRTLGHRPVEGLPFYRWDSAMEPPAEAFESLNAVIHLAGENVAQRWTEPAQRRIRESRIDGTRRLVSALAKLSSKPTVLVSASAVGIYGDRGDELLTESSSAGSGFLAALTSEWEAEARRAEQWGIRVVTLRIGVVLGRDGGAFPKLSRPFRLGVGGRLGSGKQWMPWIHIDDVVSLIVFAVDRGDLHGPVNATAPNPVTNAQFTRTLGSVLHRPTLMIVPTIALHLALGKMASALLASERVLPAAAESAGFEFQYRELAPALRNLSA